MTTQDGVYESEGVSLFGESVLTVGQLRQLLANVPDYVHVAIATEDWYRNVSFVAIPDADNNLYSAVTLYQGSNYDCRQ